MGARRTGKTSFWPHSHSAPLHSAPTYNAFKIGLSADGWKKDVALHDKNREKLHMWLLHWIKRQTAEQEAGWFGISWDGIDMGHM